MLFQVNLFFNFRFHLFTKFKLIKIISISSECKVEKFSVEGSSLANAERLWKLSETLVGLGAQKD
jgi:hypothetical protein